MKKFSFVEIIRVTIFSIHVQLSFLVSLSLAISTSCNNLRQSNYIDPSTPRIVKAKGNLVPEESTPPPRVTPLGEVQEIQAGKPKVTKLVSHECPAGNAEVNFAKPPFLNVPGTDNFQAPVIIPAIGKSVTASIPEIVVAKDASIKDIDPESFSSFKILQGLKHNIIRCMMQDRMGNLWFGTFGGGVSKYDGKYFTHYTNIQGLSSDAIWSILEDKAGNIWFGTLNEGLNKFDGKVFTHFSTADGLIDNSVYSIVQDQSGNLWFGTDGGISKFDGKSFTNFTTAQGLSSNRVRSILEDKAGELWIGTQGGGICSFDGKAFRNYSKAQGLHNGTINTIFEDKTGTLWIGTNGGITKFDGKTFSNFSTAQGLSNDTVLCISEERAGSLWFGTSGGGIYKYNQKTFTHYTSAEGLSNDIINCLMEDKTGTLWSGTNGGGICKFQGNSFTHFTTAQGLAHNIVMSILEDKKGNLWFGTWGGGVSKFDGESFINYSMAQGLGNNTVYSMLEDKDGNIWFGTLGKGLSKFDGKTFTNYSANKGFNNLGVWNLMNDKEGNIWLGTWGGGLIKFDGKSFTHYDTTMGLGHLLVDALATDKDGNIWIGSWGGGLSKFDGKSITNFKRADGLSSNEIFGILVDRSNNKWIATGGGGVDKYDGETFTNYNTNQGLSNDNITSMLEDKTGNIWIGTRSGLNRMIKQENKASLEKSDGTNSAAIAPLFKNYLAEDGLLGLNCFKNSILEDSHGAIWVGTGDRLSRYHPEGEIPDTIPPNIQLINVSLYNENIDWLSLAENRDTSLILSNGVSIRDYKFDSLSRWYRVPENLSLAYDNNYLTFKFIGITQKNSYNVKYRYKLEGLDKNWSAASDRNEAPYGNLPNGDYTFKVRAMNSEGYWSKELDYPFTVRSPWWKTTWAYSLYALLLLVALWRFDKLQKQRTIRIEKQKAQIKELAQAREIEKAYTELKIRQTQLIQSEKMASLGELTAGIAHEIQNPLNFVNNFSDVNKELLIEMKDEIDKGNFEMAKSFADSILENEDKINHHGRRADGIVKGMLMHSRTSTGQMELTDVNQLADEYLRLSYHGIKARDKNFNATMKTDFDQNIHSVNLVPQDIGRVLLNLCNNAFYAVTEKANEARGKYDPTVEVTSKKNGKKVEITVKDNGNGISQNLIDKIFQPFFTTKPTGQGTGLGLSISYDIVKALGGEISVNTMEGEFTEFVVQIPIA